MPRRGATDRLKWVALGSWFDKLTTSGRDPVRPEALEGRTGYFQSSRAEGLLRKDMDRFEIVAKWEKGARSLFHQVSKGCKGGALRGSLKCHREGERPEAISLRGRDCFASLAKTEGPFLTPSQDL